MALPNLEGDLKAMSITKKPQLRISTILKEEAEQFLKKHHVEIGSSQMSSKLGDVHRGKVDLDTNVHGIVMNPNVIFYRYEVTIYGVVITQDQNELTKKISEFMSSDARRSDRRDRCRDVIALLKALPNGYFSDKRCVFFDLQSILFSLDKLENNSKYTVMSTEMPDRPDHEKFYRYEVHVRKASEGFEIRLGDLSGLTQDLALCDHSLSQLLDIATSQYAMFTPSEHVTFSTKLSFLLSPPDYGFCEDDTAIFEDTKCYLAIGANKAVRFVEGPSEKGHTMGVVVQTKKTPFHHEINLLEKANALVGQENVLQSREYDRVRLDSFLKGLWVELDLGGRLQRFCIKKVSRYSATNRMITVKDEEISVEQYFAQAYQIALIAPTAPLIECKGRQGMILYFPMEVCWVCENQRVKPEQHTPAMTQASIRTCAVPPSKLLELNRKTVKSLHLWDNPELSSADIKVVEIPMGLEADVVPAPIIEFMNQKQVTVTNKFTWAGDKYIFPSQRGPWAAYAFLGVQDANLFSSVIFENFLRQYVAQCQQSGMQINRPNEVNVLDCSYATIDNSFKNGSDKGYEFLFAVHGDSDDDAHAAIKYAERNYSLVSQSLRISTLRNVAEKSQRWTLRNIVNKTNIKLGGLNYSLASSSCRSLDKGAKNVLDAKTLYIGFASSHPGGGFKVLPQELTQKGQKISYPAPTVVGYSANIGPNGSFDFAGDFMYQQPYREEKVDVIAIIIERCVDLFKQRNGAFPERVVVYRGGCSEGQFKMILEYEVPLVKYAFLQLGCESKLTVIVVNKLQEVRFFNKKVDASQGADVQNIQPGVVIDHTVVHPVFCEFFLNSHRALQGTARTPKYTVLLDESNMKLGQIEEMSYHLCYGHQIVYLPTSLPTPVYVANRYAERGSKLYQQHMLHGGSQEDDYETLTEQLCYYEGGGGLFGYRVNA